MCKMAEDESVLTEDETTLLLHQDSNKRISSKSRRRSSQAAWQPEPHLAYHNEIEEDNDSTGSSPSKGDSSSLAIWVVVSVSLLGESSKQSENDS